MIAARKLNRRLPGSLAEDTLAGDVDEVQLSIGEFAGRVGSSVGDDFDREHESLSARDAACGPGGRAPARMVGSPLDRRRRLTG